MNYFNKDQNDWLLVAKNQGKGVRWMKMFDMSIMKGGSCVILPCFSIFLWNHLLLLDILWSMIYYLCYTYFYIYRWITTGGLDIPIVTTWVYTLDVTDTRRSFLVPSEPSCFLTTRGRLTLAYKSLKTEQNSWNRNTNH